MADFEIFVKVLLAIAAGIVALGGAYGVIEHLSDRANAKRGELADKVAEHEHKLEEHAEHLYSDNKRLNDVENSNRLIMRGVMQLMSHEIDGNHTSQLKETRDDMEQYLINK